MLWQDRVPRLRFGRRESHGHRRAGKRSGHATARRVLLRQRMASSGSKHAASTPRRKLKRRLQALRNGLASLTQAGSDGASLRPLRRLTRSVAYRLFSTIGASERGTSHRALLSRQRKPATPTSSRFGVTAPWVVHAGRVTPNLISLRDLQAAVVVVGTASRVVGVVVAAG